MLKVLLLSLMLGFAGLTALPDAAWAQSCRELKRACDMKDQLGERGEGNCRRFRELCGRSDLRERCDRLRRACLFKEERGEQGEGNCRRYREQCGQRGRDR